MAVRSVRREKYKFKWTKELIFLIVGLLAVIITTICLALPTKEQKFADTWKDAQITKESAISEKSESDILSLISQKSGYVFVFYGTPKDEGSVNNIKVVEQVSKQLEIEEVYWLDSTDVYETTDEVKNGQEFKKNIEEREKALGGVDLLKHGSFWAFDAEGKLVLDSSTYDSSYEFIKVVTKGFGLSKSK